MVRCWIAAAVLTFAPIAHADFDPIGADGWPKGTSLAELRGLPRCEGPLRGQPGAEITCRPRITGGGAQIAYSMDWTTGLSLGEGTSGGSHAWGHELLVGMTRSWQLGGRYELIGTGLAGDRMSTTTIGHNMFALARYRWFADEVARSAWVFGAGVGWAARDVGGAPISRLSIGHDFGSFVTQHSALTAGLELAYERSFDDEASQQHVVGSLKLGFELGIREPRNLDEPAPRASGPSVRVGLLGMPAVSFGFDAAVGFGRGRVSWENSLGFLFGIAEDRALTGLQNGQWTALTGARLHWWQVAYAQAQVGAAWVAADDGARIEGRWHGELGISLGCVETGFWIRQSLEGDQTSGGLLFRIGRANGPSMCGGRSSEPRFAVEYKPPPPPPEPIVEQREPPALVDVEQTTTPPPAPPVVEDVVAPVVIELDIGVRWVGRSMVLQLDQLPVARLQNARVAIELIGAPQLLRGAEVQLRQLLGAAGIRVDAWAVVAAPSTGVRVRFTVAPR